MTTYGEPLARKRSKNEEQRQNEQHALLPNGPSEQGRPNQRAALEKHHHPSQQLRHQRQTPKTQSLQKGSQATPESKKQIGRSPKDPMEPLRQRGLQQ